MERLRERIKKWIRGPQPARPAAARVAVPVPAPAPAPAPTPAAPKPLASSKNPQVDELLGQAERLFRSGQGAEALKLAQKAERLGGEAEGLFYLQGLCLDLVGRHEESWQAFKKEVALHPGHSDAAAWADKLGKALARPVTAKIPTSQRSWKTSLPRETLLGIQKSLHNYQYRGTPMLKNPFDFAIYPLLLWKLRPRTLIELGSKSGGSALWFGDLFNNFGIDGHVYSIDIVRVDNLSHPRVTYMEGNGRKLGETLSREFLEKLPRPWLVIEDADHAYETSIAALRFFHPWLRPDEYIVIEDGIISDLAEDPACNSGPHKALKEFLGEFRQEYEIDGDYCDVFGYNITWCTNGFLKKLAPPPPVDPAEAMRDIEAALLRGQTEDAFAKISSLKARREPVQSLDLLRAKAFLKVSQPAGAIEALKEELRYFPDNAEAKAMLEELRRENPPSIQSSDPEFRELLEQIQPHTMVGEARLYSLFTLAKEICEQDLPGNFVECGVAAGGSSALLAAVISRHSKRPRLLFSCDSFEGLPPTTEFDVHQGLSAEAAGWGAGTCSAPPESLLSVCSALNVAQFVRPVKGFFSETLPAHREQFGPIALLHVDGDWYSSTTDILENLFDQVVPGGKIQIDDYGYWDGCKRAVQEFESRRGLRLSPQVIDFTGVWVEK